MCNVHTHIICYHSNPSWLCLLVYLLHGNRTRDLGDEPPLGDGSTQQSAIPLKVKSHCLTMTHIPYENANLAARLQHPCKVVARLQQPCTTLCGGYTTFMQGGSNLVAQLLPSCHSFNSMVWANLQQPCSKVGISTMALCFSREEAARMWHKREQEWEKERAARERLMKEVLQKRQAQLDQKMELLRDCQKESIKRREVLLQEMDIANKMAAREEEEKRRNREHDRLELERQVWQKCTM